MLFTAKPKTEVKDSASKPKSPTSPVSSPPSSQRTEPSNESDDNQRSGKEAEHFLINFFLKKENLKASLLLEHLSRYNDHTNGYKGCWQFLCNKLYDLEIADIEFYLPQLLNIYVRRVMEIKSPLERYFLEKSMESVHFAIRLCWLLDAQIQQLYLTQTVVASSASQNSATAKKNPYYSDDAPRSIIERCINLRNMVEQVSINQIIPEFYLPRQVNDDERKQMNSYLMSNVFSKQRRMNYFNDQMEFWNFLTDLSTRLKAYPSGPIRKQRMKIELEALNKCIPNGCYVPQCNSTDAHCRIVRIATSDCIVFSTKERVPYLIVVEVIENPYTVATPELAHFMNREFAEQSVTSLQVLCSANQVVPTNVVTPRNHSRTTSLNVHSIEDIDFEESVDPVVESSLSPRSRNSLPVTRVISAKRSFDELNRLDNNTGVNEERRTSLELPKVRFQAQQEETVFTDHKLRVEKDLGGEDEFVVVDKDKLMDADREALLKSVFGESWEDKKKRLKSLSPFGKSTGWDIKSFIVKSNDDIRQEQFAMQLIKMFQKIFLEEKLPVYLRTYHISVTNADSGLIEAVTDTTSIDGLKKKFPTPITLYDFFQRAYGLPESKRFKKAQQNFLESMAGYSVVCYLLQIKDRHNGNILIDREGNIVHIDFGFILGNSPGGVGFESAPFKLTLEFIEVMGGTDGEMFNNYFRPLVFMCFKAAAKHKEKILSLIRMMSGTNFPCFMGDPSATQTLKDLEQRFHAHLDDIKFAQWVRDLVDESMDNWRTRQYDSFQRLTNGIL